MIILSLTDSVDWGGVACVSEVVSEVASEVVEADEVIVSVGSDARPVAVMVSSVPVMLGIC